MTVITPTLEHVARAIAGGIGSHNYVNGCWHLHIPSARLAMVALKEPTPEMLEVIRQHVHPDWVTHYGAVWEEAIEAGLGELPEVSPERVMKDLEEVQAVLTRLQGMGVRRIEDFGSRRRW